MADEHETTPTPEPAQTSPEAPESAPEPAASPAAAPEEVITIPQRAFQERLDRHARKILREAGIESLEELAALKQQAAEREAAEAERRKAEMSQIERAQAEAAEAKQALEAERAAREQEAQARAAAERNAERARLLASKGIRDADYAAFVLDRAAAGLDEGQALDESAHLDELLRDARERYRLGVEETPPAAKPATTSPQSNTAPAPKPKEGQGAYDAHADENFQDTIQRRYGVSV